MLMSPLWHWQEAVCAGGPGSLIVILSLTDIFPFWTHSAFTAQPWILSVKFCDTDRPSGDISEISNFHAAEKKTCYMELFISKVILGIKSVWNLSQLQVKTAAFCKLVAQKCSVQEWNSPVVTSALLPLLCLKASCWRLGAQSSRWHLLGEGVSASLITAEYQQ